MKNPIRKAMIVAMAVVCLIGVGAASFYAGWMSGTRYEVVNGTSMDVYNSLRVLRQIDANDISGAKSTLLTALEQRMLLHWAVTRAGTLDYPQGEVPNDIRMMERAVKARAELAEDPAVAAAIATRVKDKSYRIVAGEIKLLESHYVRQR